MSFTRRVVAGLGLGQTGETPEDNSTIGVKNMIPRVREAKYVKDFVIKVRFADDVEAEIDLEGDLDGEIFEPLKDASYFKTFIVHPELHTLTWPNGADFAPEYLYQKVLRPA